MRPTRSYRIASRHPDCHALKSWVGFDPKETTLKHISCSSFSRDIDYVIGAAHRKSRLGRSDEILVIACSRDRIHCCRVQQAVLNEALVDMDADHLAKDDVRMGRVSVGVIEPHCLQPFAFHRAG